MAYNHMNACPLKGKKALKVLNDPGYQTQEKFKGIRAFMIVTDRGSFICTRGGHYVEDNFEHLKNITCNGRRYILDGELWQLGVEDETIAGWANSKYLTEDTSGVTFQCFDIVEYQGHDLTETGLGATQKDRDQFRLAAVSAIARTEVRFVPYLDGDPDERFAEIVARGGEGIILRNMSAVYTQRLGDNRPANHIFKVKASDNFDVVCVGFKPGKGKFDGLIGSIEYGMYVDGEVLPLGYCSGISDQMRRAITKEYFEYFNQVFEVKAAGQDPNSGALIEPRLIRWRTDKYPEECVWQR